MKKAPNSCGAGRNTLTARWCSQMGGEGYALSGPGCGRCWRCLPRRPTAWLAPSWRRSSTDRLNRRSKKPWKSSTSSAAASDDRSVWVSGLAKGVPPGWRLGRPLPNEVVGALTNQAALDRWADEQTGGLIDKFPIAIDEETLLVLASRAHRARALAYPFEGYPRVRGDRVAGRSGPRRSAVTGAAPRRTCRSRRYSMMS